MQIFIKALSVVFLQVISCQIASGADEELVASSESIKSGSVYLYPRGLPDTALDKACEAFISDLKTLGKWKEGLSTGYAHRQYGRYPYLDMPHANGWLSYVLHHSVTCLAMDGEKVISSITFSEEEGGELKFMSLATGALEPQNTFLAVVKRLEEDLTFSQSDYEISNIHVFFKKSLLWLKGKNDNKFIPLQDIDFLKFGQVYTEEDVGIAIGNIEKKWADL